MVQDGETRVHLFALLGILRGELLFTLVVFFPGFYQLAPALLLATTPTADTLQPFVKRYAHNRAIRICFVADVLAGRR